LVPAAKAQPTDPCCVDLVAGQFYDVGEVCVWHDVDYLYVRYETIGGIWPLNITHLAVEESSPDDIPQKNGNPIPGQFPYTEPWDSGPNFDTYRIPLVAAPILSSNGKKVLVPGHNWAEGDTLYIAAHSVVGICDCESLELILPDTVDADVHYPGDSSYFIVTISGDGILDGEHKGWCADADDEISRDGDYTGDIYTSICDDLADLPEGLIANPGNLDLVNWLLNNWEDLGYTAGDAQAAIWILLSGHLPSSLSSILASGGKGWPASQDYDETDTLALVAAAEAHDGFEPGCGDVMAVIFVPPIWDTGRFIGLPRQTVMFEVPAPCGCQTAWGADDGTDVPGPDDGDGYKNEFPGNDWALYLIYQIPVTN